MGEESLSILNIAQLESSSSSSTDESANDEEGSDIAVEGASLSKHLKSQN